MKIIPAIDLYYDQCVRLYQGQFEHVTFYNVDPLIIAKNYASQGATDLHVVDLVGAKEGKITQLNTALTMKKATSLNIQFGGGIRTIQQAENLIGSGIDRIVIGSMAVKHPESTQKLLAKFGTDKIILAIDIIIEKEPLIVMNGWQEKSKVKLWSLVENYKSFSELQILCTDISRDGTLSSPNVELYKEGVKRYPKIKWIASGGISQLADLKELMQCQVTATIVGKALYEKRFSLSESLDEIGD